MLCQASRYQQSLEQTPFQKGKRKKIKCKVNGCSKHENQNKKVQRSLGETASSQEEHPSSLQWPNRQQIQQCIGVLQSKWTNSNNQKIAVCYGTAFAIAQDVILTCAHNVFSQRNRMVCDEIKFIPGKAKSSNLRQETYYTSTCRFIAFEKLGFFERYSQKPLAKDFAVILLKKQLPFHKFLSLTSRELVEGQTIEIMGYPRRKKLRLGFERVDLQGEVIETRAHIIVHNMTTQSGHSGSPILCRTQINGKWRYEVCGLHSHKGPLYYNRGVAIIEDIRLKIDESISSLRERQTKT